MTQQPPFKAFNEAALMMRRINRAARARARGDRVSQTRTHGRVGSDAAPHEHERPARPPGAPDTFSIGKPQTVSRHRWARRARRANHRGVGVRSLPTPPRARAGEGTGGISPRWPSHWRPTPPACRCTPRVAPLATALSPCLPSPQSSSATSTLSAAAEVSALLCYIYGAHWSADTSSTTPAA